MKNLITLLAVLFMLGACSTADTTGNITEKDYNIQFTNSGSGNLIVIAPTDIDAVTTSTTEQTTDNDPATEVSPSTALGLNGSTASLAESGAEMVLEGITSMIGAGLKNPIVPPVQNPEIVPPVGNTKENLDYHGRHNGDRATWYALKNMREYPAVFILNVDGCQEDLKVTNNGTRWEEGGYIAKQSDVEGRGMAIVAPSSCLSEKASIEF